MKKITGFSLSIEVIEKTDQERGWPLAARLWNTCSAKIFRLFNLSKYMTTYIKIYEIEKLILEIVILILFIKECYDILMFSFQ